MAEATATYSAEQVERLLICAICLDRFNSPKILPCQHTFCRRPCLEGLIDRQVGMIKCPECRSHHIVPREGADGFPTNITVSGFLDLPTQRSDTAMEVGGSPQQGTAQSAGKCTVCETEADTVKCFHCEMMVCDSCKQLHLGQMKIDIGRLLNQVRRGIPQLSNTISSVEQKSERFKTQVETVKSEVTNTMERYTKELKDREKMLHSELETYLQGELRLLRLHQENIEVELASISSYCDSTETMLNQGENSSIPERDLVSIKKQCSDYLGQIHETSNNPIPDLREVSFRYSGDSVHSSIMGLGELQITTPSTGNTTRDHAPSTQTRPVQPAQTRGRWSDVDPIDVATLESFRVSPSFSYASTQRTGRRSHSPPQVRESNSTHYTRPTRSSMEVNSRMMHGFHPSQTLPTVRNFPSRTNDYLFQMESPSSEDLLDIMDRNRREEMNRRLRGGRRYRGAPADAHRQRQERVAGLMGGIGGGGGPGFQSAPDPSVGTSYNIIPQISSANGTGSFPDQDSRSRTQGSDTSSEISRAAAEAAERRARNTALTRTTDSRPAAAFIIPLTGGPPQDISRNQEGASAQAEQAAEGGSQGQSEEAPASESNSSLEPPQEQVSETSQTQPEQTNTEPDNTQQPDSTSTQPAEEPGSSTQTESQSSPQEVPSAPSAPSETQPQSQESSPQSRTQAASQPEPQREARRGSEGSNQPRETSNAPAQSRDRRGARRRRAERSNSNNETCRPQASRRRGNSSSDTGTPTTQNSRSRPSQAANTSTNVPQPSTSTAEPPTLPSRSRTFVQEEGPSTSSGANVPTVNSSTFDVPISETLGDLDTSELDNISVSDSLTVGRPLINYQSKGTLKKKIGGDRGNRQGSFTWPRGVAVSPINDGIVVADSSNHRVQIFDLDGRFVATFGSYGQADGEFDCLAGVAVNRTGQIIIADRYNHRIQVFDRYGEFSHSFGQEGDGNGQMNYPWGVTTDRGGFVYVCDKENHRIQVFQTNGTFVRKFGGLGSRAGKLENPHYIAVGYDGNVYVSDCSNHRIQVFSDTGRFIRTIGIGEGSDDGQLKSPKGIGVDRQGFVVVADSGNNRIQVFRGDGHFYCSFGSGGSDPGHFKGLEGLALLSNGDIVVSDKENHRIQIF